jgi:maleylacetoacetate isomerase
VPTLEIDGHQLTQSLAILDYLDANYDDPPFVSKDPARRSKTLAQALLIACDIHPLNNLRVLKYLGRELGAEEPARDDWYRHWVREGFVALERMAEGSSRYLGGDTPDLADICLVPQMFNARRFKLDLAPYPTLVRVDAALQELDAFASASPDRLSA